MFKTFPELTRLDRCDGCHGQARFACILGNSELLFCQFCFNLHQDALREQGWAIDDQTEKFLDIPPLD